MTDPTSLPLPPTSLLNGATLLTHLGVIRVTGADAKAFLHSQLTHDFAQLDMQHARLAAYLTPKGRMQASFIGWQHTSNEILLVCMHDLLETTRQYLNRFVLRAKAKLEDATSDYQLYGLAGEAARAVLPANSLPWSRVDVTDHTDGTATAVHLYPACGVSRALWLTMAENPPPKAPLLHEHLWQWGEVHSGIATVSAAIAGAFVPQMLNYESVGGVNFKKGCYPGQEVVARSQFRGTLKRRTYVAHAAGQAKVGEEVFSASDPEQAVGTVVQVAPMPDGSSGMDTLVSLQTTAAEQALQIDGQPLTLLPLPYALLEDL